MEQNEKEKSQVVIDILDKGPLLVTGNIIFRDLKRDIIEQTERVCLCRCGKSRNQPYCDDLHKK